MMTILSAFNFLSRVKLYFPNEFPIPLWPAQLRYFIVHDFIMVVVAEGNGRNSSISLSYYDRSSSFPPTSTTKVLPFPCKTTTKLLPFPCRTTTNEYKIFFEGLISFDRSPLRKKEMVENVSFCPPFHPLQYRFPPQVPFKQVGE